MVSLVLAAFTSSAASGDDRVTIGGLIYDVAIERPLGLAETVAGVGMAGIAYPFALPSGKTALVVDRCITRPGRDTFVRPLGDQSDRPASNCSPVAFSFGLVRLSFGLVERPLGYLFSRSPFSREEPRPSDELEVDGTDARSAPDAVEI